MDFNAGYAAATRDVIAWLSTQTPVPICQSLAARIVRGEHLGRARESGDFKQWEIPVRFRKDVPLWAVESIRLSLFADSLNLCASKSTGGFVVIPFSPLRRDQVDAVIEFLKGVTYLTEIGEPAPFDLHFEGGEEESRG